MNRDDDKKESGQAAGPMGQARQNMNEAELQAVHLVPAKPLNGPVRLAEYDPNWPRLFEREAARVRKALGDKVLLLEHVGSTAVPGLAAKPRIDMLLIVADSSDEARYIPALEAAGYVLHIREPNWHQHRTLKGPDIDINLHVFSRGCPEIERMLLFRDWLRAHQEDRALYEHTKRELAKREWKYTQNYADAKSAVVEEIIARAQEARDNRWRRRCRPQGTACCAPTRCGDASFSILPGGDLGFERGYRGGSRARVSRRRDIQSGSLPNMHQ